MTRVGLVTGTATTASRHARREERKQLLEDGIKRLPSDYAEVLRLYDLEQLSAPEVAKAMKRSVGAVYMLRARALDALPGVLGPESNFLTRPG